MPKNRELCTTETDLSFDYSSSMYNVYVSVYYKRVPEDRWICFGIVRGATKTEKHTFVYVFRFDFCFERLRFVFLFRCVKTEIVFLLKSFVSRM